MVTVYMSFLYISHMFRIQTNFRCFQSYGPNSVYRYRGKTHRNSQSNNTQLQQLFFFISQIARNQFEKSVAEILK